MVSKSVWNLPGGPWERLFAGVWNRFNVAVYENNEKILLTTIFPKSGEVNWIMLRVDKILLVPSGFEKIEHKLQDKELHLLRQQIPGDRMTYLILLSPPTTVEFGSKEIGSRVFQKVLSLKEESDEIKKIARSEGVKILELSEANYKDSAKIMGNPTLLLSLLSIAPEGEEPEKEKLKDIVLGEYDDKLFSVPETIFSSFVTIKKGTEEERNYLAQAIIEESIIDVTPIPIIINFSKYPPKLDQANPYPYNYDKYGFETQNVGFKLRSYDSSKDELGINLNNVGPQFLWKLFGLGTDEVSTNILQAASVLQESKSLDNIGALIKKIDEAPEGNDKQRRLKRDSVRILRTLGMIYGNIFSKEKDLSKEIYQWVKNNETVLMNLKDLDKPRRLAMLLYLLESIESLRGSGKLSSVEEKRIENIYYEIISMDWFGSGLLQSQIIGKMIPHNKGLFVSEDSLPMEIESRSHYRFHLSGSRKAKFFGEGRGAKEFEIRPLLSCPP
jgi:hypothetical protein